ncbi:MAG: PD-(D/E)XK nuclease family protein [Candidatus Methylomirabilales bacterium]
MTDPTNRGEAAILPRHIDSTMITAFRACPRKFYNEFVLGHRPVEIGPDLHAGGCFATALEAFYRTYFTRPGTPTHRLELGRIAAIKAFTAAWGLYEPPANHIKTQGNVWLALEQYLETYPPHTDHIQPYLNHDGEPMLEYTFAIPLEEGFPHHPDGDAFLLCGRFDMLGTYHGRPCIKDEKTTKYAGATWADQWNLRNQFLTYVWACQQSGFPTLNTAVIRGVIIQKTNPRQVEAIKVYPPHLISRWYDQLRRDLHRLRRAWDDDHWDFNLGETCTNYGLCPFMTSCQALDPMLWLKDLPILRWDPLHRDPTQPTEPVHA